MSGHDWSEREVEIEGALVAQSAERYLAVLEFARQLGGNLAEEHRILAISVREATAALEAWAAAWRAGAEADFDEIVAHFDDEARRRKRDDSP